MPDYTSKRVSWNETSGRMAHHIRDGATSTVWMVRDEQNGQWVMKIPFQHSGDLSRFRPEIEVVKTLQSEGLSSLPDCYNAQMEDGTAGIVMPYYAVEDQAFLARQRSEFLESEFFSFARQVIQLFSTCAKVGIRNTDIKDENFYWLDGKLIVLDWNRCEDMRDPVRDEKEMTALVTQVLYLIFIGKNPPASVNGVDPAWAAAIPRPLRRILYLITRGMLNFERLGQELKWWGVLAKLEHPFTADKFERALAAYDLEEESEAVLDLNEMATSIPPLPDDVRTWMESHATRANWQQRQPIRELDEALSLIRQDWEDFQLDAARSSSIQLAQRMVGKLIPAEKLGELARVVVVSVWLKKLPLTILGEGKKKVHSLVKFWLDWQPLDAMVTDDRELAAGVQEASTVLQNITDWVNQTRSLVIQPFSENAYSDWEKLRGQLQQWGDNFKANEGLSTVLDLLETCLPVWKPSYKAAAGTSQIDPKDIEFALSQNESPGTIRKHLEAGERQGDLIAVYRLICLVEEEAWAEVLSWCNHIQGSSAVIHKAREYARERCIQWVEEKTGGTVYLADFRYLDGLINQLGIIDQLPKWRINQSFFNKSFDEINNEDSLSACVNYLIEPCKLNVEDRENLDASILLTLLKACRWVDTLRMQMGGGNTMDVETLINKAKELVDKKDELTTLISSVGGIKTSLAELDGQVSQVQESLNIRNSSVSQLNAELNNLKTAFTDIRAGVDGMDVYNQATLQTQIGALTHQLNSLKAALDPAVVLQLAYTLAFARQWGAAIQLLEYSSKVHSDGMNLTQASMDHLKSIYGDMGCQWDFESWASGLATFEFDKVYSIIKKLKDQGHEEKPYFAWLFAITYTTQMKSNSGWLDLLYKGDLDTLQTQLAAAPNSIECDYMKTQVELFKLAKCMKEYQDDIPIDNFWLLRQQIPDAIWAVVFASAEKTIPRTMITRQ
ncbi:protein kinase domain [Longilinea arvoryzae]|uniref:Protein kinase domain n=1 Tax=Longilinea arvoryzae TaxID=360412 RepID=A0A0S7B772_9CHLR|nr:hypothetical protein [Longilinea arvoryzae]GAP13180.1 protein kinase domain [Longilinea arvoryzae]